MGVAFITFLMNRIRSMHWQIVAMAVTLPCKEAQIPSLVKFGLT